MPLNDTIGGQQADSSELSDSSQGRSTVLNNDDSHFSPPVVRNPTLMAAFNF